MTSSSFRPDYVDHFLHAGHFLEEVLDEKGMKQVDLAKRTGLTTKTINAIIQGRAPLTPDTAYALELVFPDKPAITWIELETAFQAERALQKQNENLESHVNILKDFPIDTMVASGWINRKESNVERLRELLKFFGVANVSQLEPVWENLSGMYRQSEAYSKEKLHIIAWLRQGERLANEIHCKPYSVDAFKSVIQECRKLTHKPFDIVKKELPTICSKAGVAVVFVKEIGKTRTTGAARWVKDKAIIQLSLRGKRNDIFWFTFFHECGHILLHGKKGNFIDGQKNEKASADNEYYYAFDNKKREAEADQFAQDVLFPRKELDMFVNSAAINSFSEDQITTFANAINVSPGLVLGHLQHRGLMPYPCSMNSKFKLKYEF